MANEVSWLTPEYIQKFLLPSFSDKELKLKNFDISSGCNEGDGYLSQILRIKIETTKRKISIIGKVLLNNSTLDEIQGSGDNVYEKEKLMLQSFLPKSLSKLPKPARFFAEFYHADDEHRSLFLEDLCEDGYQLCDHKSNGLDLQHSLLVMEALAKLHGTSYLVFKDDPSLVKNFDKYFYREENRTFLENLVINVRRAFAEIMDDWKLPEKYKNKLRNMDDWASKVIRTWDRKDNQLNVLVQTDCWVNNLMFKYGKNGVEAVKMIDFQLGTYNSFALDVTNFMFANTNIDVRTNHISALVDHYFNTFTGITGNIPNFGKERLWKELKDRMFMGFFTMVCWGGTIFAPPKTKPLDLDAIARGEENVYNFQIYHNPKYLDCLEKLLPYFVENNVI